MTFELLRIRICGFNHFSICEKAESACSRHKLTGSPLYALAFSTFCKKDCSVVILSFHSAKKVWYQELSVLLPWNAFLV